MPNPVDLEPDDLVPHDEPLLDRWAFDAWRRTRAGTNARRISDAIHQLLSERESRQRKRKQNVAKTFEALVDAVVANLLRVQLDPSQRASIEDEGRGWIRIPLSSRRLKSTKRSRYDASPMPLGALMTRRETGRLDSPGIIEAMADLSLIYLDKAPRHEAAGRASAIKCREQLLELIRTHSPRLDELELLICVTAPDGKSIEPEHVELREPAPEKPSWRYVKRRARWQVVEYDDTEQTDRWRADLRLINEGLGAADIRFDADAVTAASAEDALAIQSGIAIQERSLKRIFNNGRWDHGGRLYGGFWQGMKRQWRSGLRINGHPVASLDFNAMFLQLLYAVKAGKQAPLEGDLYEGIDPPEGWPDDLERRLAMRDAIKRNLNAMLFPKSPDKPHRLVQGTKAALSLDVTGAVLEDRIRAKHPEIAAWLRLPGIGFELMFHESEIMASVLRLCLQSGTVVLPLHDGLLVGEDGYESANGAMKDAFRNYFEKGLEARVSGFTGSRPHVVR